MNGSSSRSFDEGDDYHDPQARDRSLRALEGRTSHDWQREGDADDEVTESENNTADIFMRIAREDSSSSLPRRRPNGRGEDDRSSIVVSGILGSFCFSYLGVRINGAPLQFGEHFSIGLRFFIAEQAHLRGGLQRSAF